MLAVLVPRFGLPWNPEDLFFLRFLAQGLRDSTSRLLLVCGGECEPSLPADWRVRWVNEPEIQSPRVVPGMAHLVPGLLEGRVAAVLGLSTTPDHGLMAWGAQRWLVAPECRRDPAAISRLEFDRLAALARPVGWLRSYALFRGNNYHVEPLELGVESWNRFREGGELLGLQLIERALECARSPLEEAALQAQAQGMRLAMRSYAEVAAVRAPASAIPGELQGFLLQAKGWGYAMLNEPALARPYLHLAANLLDPSRRGREALYLMNITALNQLKSGNAEDSLVLEQEIEATLALQSVTDWRLTYVNYINLARLHRRQRNYEQAERAFQRAFATTLGARTENDAIYSNVCLARLAAESGRMDQAFLRWIRAALHWAASVIPEALGPRVASAILGRVVSVHEAVCEEISDTLCTSLVAAAKHSRIWPNGYHQSTLTEAAEALGAPIFLRAEETPSHVFGRDSVCAIGLPGWSLLLSDEYSSLAPYAGPCHQRLRGLLYQLLNALTGNEMPLPPSICILDDRLGCEMAVSRHELLQTCLRWGVGRMIFNSEVIELAPTVRQEFEARLHVRLGDAVDRIQFDGRKSRVTFKRYLRPRWFAENESLVLSAIESGACLASLERCLEWRESQRSVLEVLRELERARVVQLFLPEEVPCTATAGTRSLSNEI